ncbi:hypothetical protein ATCVMN08101_1018R [Acanthocystis turfacea Chlorella virus MN0810.1]|nr:hypothetical protein ATCVMN08101_1018R [Acanthocystis turfacea Chlorella virus MN0810.1]
MTNSVVVRDLKQRYLRDAKKYQNNPVKLSQLRKAHMEALRMHLYFDPIEPPMPKNSVPKDAVPCKGCFFWRK